MARAPADSPTRPARPLRPFVMAQRGSSLAGKAYWAMVQRVALTAAAIDLAYIALFLWLGPCRLLGSTWRASPFT